MIVIISVAFVWCLVPLDLFSFGLLRVPLDDDGDRRDDENSSWNKQTEFQCFHLSEALWDFVSEDRHQKCECKMKTLPDRWATAAWV